MMASIDGVIKGIVYGGIGLAIVAFATVSAVKGTEYENQLKEYFARCGFSLKQTRKITGPNYFILKDNQNGNVYAVNLQDRSLLTFWPKKPEEGEGLKAFLISNYGRTDPDLERLMFEVNGFGVDDKGQPILRNDRYYEVPVGTGQISDMKNYCR